MKILTTAKHLGDTALPMLGVVLLLRVFSLSVQQREAGPLLVRVVVTHPGASEERRLASYVWPRSYGVRTWQKMLIEECCFGVHFVNRIALAPLAICLQMLLCRSPLPLAVRSGGHPEVSFKRTHEAGTVTVAR